MCSSEHTKFQFLVYNYSNSVNKALEISFLDSYVTPFFLKLIEDISSFLDSYESHIYLAQKLCFWTGIIFTRVYVSVCVCLSLSVYLDYLKKFFTDFDETWQDDV